MTRKVWFFFIVTQAIGESCFWTWEYVHSQVGLWLWGCGLILLFPGNFLSAIAIEKLLWNKGLTLIQLSALEVPIEIAINAVLWLLCIKLWSLVQSKVKTRR